MSKKQTDLAVIESALERVRDESIDLEERGPLYAMLRGWRLRIDRAIRPVGREIELAMAAVDAREWGTIRLNWVAVDPKYPCNNEGNWQDAMVQDTLKEWREEANFRPFIHKIPAHYEVDTAALGKALVDGDPGARDFYGLLNACGYRTEEARAPRLSVRDAA